MSDIGAIPTKTSVRITSTTGDFGTIPGATRTAAGVMTADQAGQLEDLWQIHLTRQSGGAPLVINSAPAVDTSQFPTRVELQHALSALPKAPDVGGIVNALRQQMADLQKRVLEAGQPKAPSVVVQQGDTTATVDTVARDVIKGIIQGMESLEDRVAEIERKFDTLRLVAQHKAQMEEGDAA